VSTEAPREAVARDAARQQLVGRRRLLPRIPVGADGAFHRRRWPWSKTSVLRVAGRFNPKTLARERFIAHKAPLWWLVFLVLTLAIPLISGSDKILTIASTFTIYASINLMWMLIMGTAGIFSLASLAVTGVAAYTACWLTINHDLPWPLMFPVGAVAGLIVGIIIAIPARRMEGMYYALLTLGISEICRAYALQAKWIGAQSQGSLSGGGGFIPEDIRFTVTGQRIGYIAGFLLLLAALATYRIVNGQRLGLLLRASQQEDEAVSESMGIDFQRARLAVFLISSAALGVVGAFYAGYFRAASLSLFGTDLLLLLFAMIVIGGIGRAEGAVVGTLVVTVIDRYFIDTGAKRILLVAILMLLSVLFTRGGAFGLKDQWQELRAKRRSSRRAARSTRHGDVLPEEATDVRDKSLIYQRRYDNAQREYLKSLISDELIAEHRKSPTGLHSDSLERLMLYFRKSELAGKYCVYAIEPFKQYRIVALSGLPGVPPRTVDDRVYTTIDDAYHAVFLRRVNDLRSS
jgi:branched-chain amino acid transport system permease protein